MAGVEWKDNSLYVAESHRITRYDGIDQTFDKTITVSSRLSMGLFVFGLAFKLSAF